MKIALALVVALSLPAAALALSPGPAAIRVTDHQLETHHIQHSTVTTGLLYNKAITKHSIGSTVLTCTGLGSGGILGSGQKLCTAIYRFPRGKLVAHGIVGSKLFYELPVVGGTGIYANVTGEVVVALSGVRPTRHRLIFALQAT